MKNWSHRIGGVSSSQQSVCSHNTMRFSSLLDFHVLIYLNHHCDKGLPTSNCMLHFYCMVSKVESLQQAHCELLF